MKVTAVAAGGRQCQENENLSYSLNEYGVTE